MNYARFSNPNSPRLAILTEDDLEDMPEERRNAWTDYGGYRYKMAYEIVTPESAEQGDADERGWIEKKSEQYGTLEDLIRVVRDHTWLEWSSSRPRGRHDWIVSEGEENYRTGANTSYSLWIEREDGMDLSEYEMDFINKKLPVLHHR